MSAVLALLFLALPSCLADFPDKPREPDISGEIVNVEPGDQVNYLIQLADGSQVPVDFTGSNFLVRTPVEGSLYLGGGQEDDRWHAFLPREGDCWTITGEAERQGNGLQFRNTIRLPLADNMDFGAPGEIEVYGDPRTQFCVSASGEITSYQAP